MHECYARRHFRVLGGHALKRYFECCDRLGILIEELQTSVENGGNHAEAKMDITQYIVGFYNCTRLHSILGYTAPAQYETSIAAKNLS